MAPPEGFRTGDLVEVSSDEDGFRGAYFEARVVRSMPKLRRYTVDYDALVDDADQSRHLRETVDARHVRPRPPCLLSGATPRLALHQPVDALHNDAWWVGVVSAAPTGRQRRFRVCFPASREEMEFGTNHLRAHLEWVGGEWVLPESLGVPKSPYDAGAQVEVAFLRENSPVAWFSAVVVKTIWKSCFLVEYINLEKAGGKTMQREIVDLQHIRPSPLRLVAKPQYALAMDIGKGKVVEVSSDEEGFAGAWFIATMLKSIGKKFLVRYHHLKTDDETELLAETVDPLHIRPTPPEIPVAGEFKHLEEVDAFHNDGWWVGVISRVLRGQRYMVYFRTWKEEIEFGHDDLRLHQDWIDGRWVRASQKLL